EKSANRFDFKNISTSQTSTMGDLQRVLSQGEYAPFTSAPMFESKFVQINRRGEPIYVHNRPNCVTIGICASSPSSSMPSVMLLAHEVPVSPPESTTNFWKFSEQPSHTEQLALTRFFPLKFVKLSVHSTDKHHLKLKLINGRSYYLELCAPPDQQHHLFHQWLQLISLLKSPENTSNTEVNVLYENFGTSQEKAHSPNNLLENVSLWQISVVLISSEQSSLSLFFFLCPLLLHLLTFPFSFKRDNTQDVSSPKTEEEKVSKKTSSKQVPLSGIADPSEESGRKEVAFHSSLKATRQGTTMESKNKGHPDTKKSKSKSTDKRKAR
uniref:Family with sequence similarity 71 member D n=1 Tax=Apteryx owenii TaxID=8824 RepID=A0A8B9NZF2_APTOW